MNHICPVCGYPDLEDPPADFEICPSCGTEFGYSDIARTYDDLRDRWLATGPRWYSRVTPQPPNWNGHDQLYRAGLGYEPIGAVSLGTSQSVVETQGITASIRSRIVA